jgi:transcriptional regulator with XRE-family HTH domain
MTGSNGRAFSEVLKRERKRRGWSQANVAEHVGTDPKSVGRWERGLNMPGPYFIQKLCEVFDTIPEAFGLFDGRQEQTPYELEEVRDQQESSSQVTSAPPSSHVIATIPPRSNRSISASSFSFPPVMFTFGQTEQALTQRLPEGTITMLFMDIEGSTRLLQQLSERYGEVLGVCRPPAAGRVPALEWTRGGHSG